MELSDRIIPDRRWLLRASGDVAGIAMTRVVLSKNWARKPKARHFRIRDESKARTAEKKWLAKSKGKSK